MKYWKLFARAPHPEEFSVMMGLRRIFFAGLLGLCAVSCSDNKKPEPVAKKAETTNQPTAVAPATTGTNVAIQFPKDEGVHPDRQLEWWYVNAQFTDNKGRPYSFVLCKFSTGRHLVSLFEKASGKTWVKDYYESVNAAEGKLDLSSITGKWKQTNAPFNYSFVYNFEGVNLDLTLKSNKKPFLPGGEGFIGMGEHGTSYYYALTDLSLTGTFKHGTNEVEILDVKGKAWMDHQWGQWDWVKDFSQWKWYSVQLDNGVDLMLFNFYKDKKLINSHCGYIDAKNSQSHKLACELLTGQYYTDPAGGKWQKEVDLGISSLPDTRLTLTAEKDDQIIEPSVLWEGSMKVKGTFKGTPVKGTAFQELNRPD